MDDTPASSGTPSQKPSKKPIFFGKDGSSLIVFIEASEVEHRPKIVRRLTDHGGTLTNDPLEAQIILVDPTKDAGKTFFRDWYEVEGKVILDCSWPKKCVDGGKAFFEDDNWAGCHLEKDSFTGAKSPLPTPRNTPIESQISRSLLPDSGIHASSANQSQQIQRENGLDPPPAPSRSPTDTGPITPTDALPQPTQPYPALSSHNGMQPFTPQYPMQIPNMYNPMMNPQMMMMDPGQMMAMAHLMAQSQNEAFKTAFQDALNSKIGSHIPSALYKPLEQRSPVQEQALPFPRIPSMSETLSKKRRSPSSSPSIRGRSLSVLSDSLHSYASKDKKGKKRATSPSLKRRKISPSSSPFENSAAGSSKMGKPAGNLSQRKVFATKSGRELSFFVQIDLKNRFNVVDAIKKNGGRIEKDAVNSDYMVLYSANKNQKPFKALLGSAQSTGKPAVPTRFIFDCVNERRLLDASDYEFDSLVKTKNHQSPVKMEQPSSDDEAEKKRIEKNARKASQRRQRKLDAEAELKSARKMSSKVKVEGSPLSKKNNSFDEATLLGRRTPTPPGEHTRLPWGSGYRFSELENQFVLEYGEILVERDHTISSSAIGSMLHKKLPHHSTNSWRNHFATLSQGKLDQWRKRSSIAYRKAMRQSQSGPSSQSAMTHVNTDDATVIELSSSPPPATPSVVTHINMEDSSVMELSSSAPSASVQNELTGTYAPGPDIEEPNTALQLENELLAKDIETIARFYAGALGNNASEDEHWASLVAQHTCRSAPNWDEFYDAHHKEVEARYNELTKQ